MIFVLILIFGNVGSYGGTSSVRVGGFNTLATCQFAGAALLKEQPKSKGYFLCVPVEHP